MDNRKEVASPEIARAEIYHDTLESYFSPIAGGYNCLTRYAGTKPLSELGCKIHFFDSNLIDLLGNLEVYATADALQNNYFLNTDTNELFYSRGKVLEKINLHNQVKFLTELSELLKKERKYHHKFLTFDEVKNLITNNSGHEPINPNLSTVMKQPTVEYSKLMQDIFPVKSEDTSSANLSELTESRYSVNTLRRSSEK